jgi:hypothetical protein
VDGREGEVEREGGAAAVREEGVVVLEVMFG